MSCVRFHASVAIPVVIALLRRCAPWAAVTRNVAPLRAAWPGDVAGWVGETWGNSGVEVGPKTAQLHAQTPTCNVI